MNTITKFIGSDRFLSLILIVLAIIGYWMIGGMEEATDPGAIAASTYPRAILICLIIACALQLLRHNPDENQTAHFPLKGVMTILIMAGYILLLEPVGYFLLTPVVLFIMPLLAGYRNFGAIALGVVLVTAILYVVFVLILNIPLPAGLLAGE